MSLTSSSGIWRVFATVFAKPWKRQKSSARDGGEGMTDSPSEEEDMACGDISSSAPPPCSSMMSFGGAEAADVAAKGMCLEDSRVRLEA